jgi:hypothetical protein
MTETIYDDGLIACDQTSLLIRRYYPWGSKRIPYSSIKSVRRVPIRIRKWRLWGTGDFLHWWNLDLRRFKKDFALELDVGHWIRPTITADDNNAVERLIRKYSPQSASSQRSSNGQA